MFCNQIKAKCHKGLPEKLHVLKICHHIISYQKYEQLKFTNHCPLSQSIMYKNTRQRNHTLRKHTIDLHTLFTSVTCYFIHFFY